MEQISVSATSFLERVLCTGKKSFIPRCFFLDVPPITLCFLSYYIFPSFWVQSLRSQTLLMVVACGTRSASAKEMHMYLSEATPCNIQFWVSPNRVQEPKTIYYMGSLRSNEFGVHVQVRLQLHFCSTHISPWKQEFSGQKLARKLIFVLEERTKDKLSILNLIYTFFLCLFLILS